MSLPVVKIPILKNESQATECVNLQLGEFILFWAVQ